MTDSETAEADEPTFGYSDALEFVSNEWRRMWETKASLEQRAITLITTSGVLVTLSFGFAAAVAKGKSFANFTTAERVLLVVALALFAVSALLALSVNWPRSYNVPVFFDLLDSRLSSPRPAPPPLERLMKALENGQSENDRKAMRLTQAFIAQLLAIVLLAITVGVVTASPADSPRSAAAPVAHHPTTDGMTHRQHR